MQVFSFEFYKIFKNSFVTEHLQTIVSAISFAGTWLLTIFTFNLYILYPKVNQDTSWGVKHFLCLLGFRHLGLIAFHLK